MKKEMQLPKSPLANRQLQLTIWLLSTYTYKTEGVEKTLSESLKEGKA